MVILSQLMVSILSVSLSVYYMYLKLQYLVSFHHWSGQVRGVCHLPLGVTLVGAEGVIDPFEGVVGSSSKLASSILVTTLSSSSASEFH